MPTEKLIPFGWIDLEEDGKVYLGEFCDDPDGSDLKWFRATGATTTIKGLDLLCTYTKLHEGRCYGTGKFYSYAGELLHELLRSAHPNASIAVFERSWSCGTKTFKESVTVKFYGKKAQRAEAA